MSHFGEGDAMVAAARAFWLGRGPGRQKVTKAEAMSALKVIVQCMPSRCYELSDDDDIGPRSPLGRLVAAAFSTTPAERRDVEGPEPDYANPWRDGPVEAFDRRFRLH